jgi:hypothetical protein
MDKITKSSNVDRRMVIDGASDQSALKKKKQQNKISGSETTK